MNRSAAADWMERVMPGHLSAFLPRQRWFGAKAQAIREVVFEDAAWLPDGESLCALVVVRVDSHRTAGTYALPLVFSGHAGDLPIVGRLDDGDGAWVADGASRTSAALALLAGFSTKSPRELPMIRGGTLLYRDADELAARVLEGRPNVRPVGAEQSNTSLRIDSALAFKLFRRLEGGENPELEISRFLTHAGFGASPQLRGSLTYAPAHGDPATLGVLQDWIQNEGDGWSHVVARLQDRGDGSAETLGGQAFTLGTITSAFHRCLAAPTGDPAFAAEPATRTDVESWYREVEERALRTVDLVAGQLPAWPAESREAGTAFLSAARRPGFVSRPPDPSTAPLAFHKIRVHGDYHLGQTLKTTSGFALIDFEGEPARPISDRRAKHPALKDVAGMVRSFEYAVETAKLEAPGTPILDAEALRHAFLDGYLSSSRLDGIALPADRRAVDAWLDFFELDKALYEVEYEVNNRPEWVRIPLSGLARILGRGTG